MSRAYYLDYLRGLMALSIMLYHYSSWAGYTPGPESLLGKLGVYGVEVFYILSGASLALVYFSRERLEKFSVVDFCLKRIFRIIPLFWVCLTTMLFLKLVESKITSQPLDISVTEIFLNYTMLFSFFSPADYILIGGWSIGNEVVFYVLFPILFLGLKKFGLRSIFALFSISFGVGLLFSYKIVTIDATMLDNWRDYVNPVNHILYFLSGILIALSIKPLDTNENKGVNFIVLVLVIIGFAFWLYPVKADINLIHGLDRLCLTILILVFVSLFFKLAYFKISYLHGPLSMLGELCYGIYLIHPIVGFSIAFLTERLLGWSVVYAYFISVPITIILAYIVHRFIEIEFINLGKIVSSRLVGSRLKSVNK